MRRLHALKGLEVKVDTPVVRGQYGGYKDEVANQDAHTETFVALTLKSTNSRWQGVPIRLATGKKLAEKVTEIKVYFKQYEDSEANLLKLRIQPNEAVELDLWVKKTRL